jgi:hypothetical protein
MFNEYLIEIISCYLSVSFNCSLHQHQHRYFSLFSSSSPLSSYSSSIRCCQFFLLFLISVIIFSTNDTDKKKRWNLFLSFNQWTSLNRYLYIPSMSKLFKWVHSVDYRFNNAWLWLLTEYIFLIMKKTLKREREFPVTELNKDLERNKIFQSKKLLFFLIRKNKSIVKYFHIIKR